MKAKKKDTGKIYEVTGMSHCIELRDPLNGNTLFSKPADLEFLDPFYVEDWEKIKIQAAISVLNSLIISGKSIAEERIDTAIWAAEKLVEKFRNGDSKKSN